MKAKSFFILLILIIPLCYGCGNEIVDIISGKYLPEPEPLAVLQVLVETERTLQIKFDEPIIFSTASSLENYLILAGNNTLEVLAVTPDESSEQIIHLVTATQSPGVSYVLSCFNIKGLYSKEIPSTGLSIEFTGFDPTSIARHFRVIPPSIIDIGTSFEVIVDAIETSSGNIIASFSDDLVWDAIGSGDITVENETGFVNGTNTVTVLYDGASIATGETEEIAIQVEALTDPTFTGTSNTITARLPVELSHFSISAPENAVKDVPFEITITAKGTDNLVYTDYNGIVNFEAVNGDTGLISPASSAAFTDGALTMDIQYGGPASGLQIRAVDNSDITITGLSSSINIGFNSLNFGGYSPAADTVHLSWQNRSDADNYKVYQDDSSSWVEIGSGVAPFTTHIETGLSADTLYRFRVEARAGTVVIEFAEISVRTLSSDCATTISGAISVSNFNAAGSPYCLDTDVKTLTSDLTIEEDVVVKIKSDSGIVIDNCTLTIQPGAKLLFETDREIVVQNGGKLVADGTPEKMIMFSSLDPAPAAGDWAGITFDGTAQGTTFNGDSYLSGSIVRFCIFEYFQRAILSNSSLLIDFSLFRHGQVSGNGSAMNFVHTGGERFVIKNSSFSNLTANLQAGGYAGGGAIYASGSENSVIQDSAFQSITASGGDLTDNGGGAIYLTGGSNYTISNNSFEDISLTFTGLLNETDNYNGGGVVRLSNASGSNIYDNTFTSIYFNVISTDENGGGVLYLTGAPDCTVTNNSFGDIEFTVDTFDAIDSEVNGGGVIYISSAPDSILSLNQIDDITSLCSGDGHTGGGAFFIYQCSNIAIDQNIFNRVFLDSLSQPFISQYGGGAIHIYSSNYCDITSNYFNIVEADSSGGQSGGGAVRLNSADYAAISENIFKNTEASGQYAEGGAIQLRDCSYNEIINNIFEQNAVEGWDAVGGGAISLRYNSHFNLITKNTFNSTIAAEYGGAIRIISDCASTDINYNDFSDYWDAYGEKAINIASSSAGTEVEHNNFNDFDGSTYIIDTDIALATCQDNWWASNISSCTDCDDAAECGVVPFSISPASAAWPLCKDDPGNEDCVGADFE